MLLYLDAVSCINTAFMAYTLLIIGYVFSFISSTLYIVLYSRLKLAARETVRALDHVSIVAGNGSAGTSTVV